MSIIDIILSPFIFIIKQLFLFSFQVSGSYGIAIILLSFAISLLLLPIFILIEKAKKKDDSVKRKMKPLIDEIKRCYKGQERYYYLKTLNRQFNYSPFRAMIPILSLLLQIPFFIAAYQYLEAFEPLQGVSFLFIPDLSAPDALLGKINFLPIAMTLVNLLTAHYYTKNGDTSERKQMVIVAGIFLVLLFNLPSGLVLYWTMNNVFSFFRLFITNPEVFRKDVAQKSVSTLNSQKVKQLFIPLLPKLKKIFIVCFAIVVVIQFNWALNHSFNSFPLRLIVSIGLSMVVTFLVGVIFPFFNRFKIYISNIHIKPFIIIVLLFLPIYFYLSAQYYFTGLNNNLSLLSTILLLPSQAIGLLYFIRVKNKINPFIYHLGSLVLVFVLILQSINLLVIIQNEGIIIKLFNATLTINNSNWSDISETGILFSTIALAFYWKLKNTTQSANTQSNWLMHVLSVLYISGLIFFWHPLIVYTSYPDIFNFSAYSILENNLNIFLYVSALGIIPYFIFPRKIKRSILFIFLCFVLICFVNTFIVPLDLGALHNSRFSEQENLAAPLFYYIFEAIFLLGVIALVRWVFNKGYFKQSTIVLIALNILLIVQSLTKTVKTNSNKDSTIISEGVIPFSENEENIVVLLLDGFQGWFMNRILDKNPELNEALTGFVWYPNTLSISSLTYSSTAAIMSGYNYSVDKLNSDINKTLGEKVTIPCNNYIDKIKLKGYNISSTKMWHSKIKKEQFDNYIPLWHNKWNDLLKNGEMKEIWYTRLWENALFNCMPISIKPKIYNNEKWLISYQTDKTSSETYKYNFLKLLPLISQKQSMEPSFIYIHNMASHTPWKKLARNNELVQKVTPFENNEWCISMLAEWIKWMKKKGVYDNTKIIILSDHGATLRDYHHPFKIESPLKVDENNPDKILLERFWRLNALLMVKDFNAKGKIEEDWRLMSNADASAIVFNENDPTKGIPINRTLPTAWAFWEKRILDKYEYDVYKYFEVKENMFDLENWKEIYKNNN
ncbi:MAG: membrane protein insertase YidC [Salinivirgaceae bacterium]|jgi:YidC/Oxa1 family membrane protein insertase|nr:membrane protein insertase YidC [Salinivirgaceae bacterium]